MDHLGRKIRILFIIIIVLFIIRHSDHNLKITHNELPQIIANTNEKTYLNNSIVSLLGKEFHEIFQLLGEPQEAGLGLLYGPHEYLLYRYKDGEIRLCSPEGLETKTVVSIVVSGELEVLGACVGMIFTEIEDIIGQSTHGPDFGMDEIYYMMYYFDGGDTHSSDFTVTFSATSLDGPTHEAFLKWESYEQPTFSEV